VQSFGAAFSLEPQGTLAVDGVTVLRSNVAGKAWLRNVTLIAETALAQLNWEISALTGNDEATGLPGAPLKTYGELLRRWGTNRPPFPNDGTVNVAILDSLPATDPITIIPVTGRIVFTGTLVPTGAPVVVAAYTPKNKATGAKSLLTVAGKVWAPVTLFHDTTVAGGASFWVNTNNGAGVAAITEPFAVPVIIFPTRAVPAPGDSIQQMTPPTIFLNHARNGGQFLGTAVAFNSFLIQTVDQGEAVLGSGCVLAECALTNQASVLGSNDNESENPFFTSCYFPASFGGGSFVGRGSFFGGAVDGINEFFEGTAFDFDCLVLSRFHQTGNITVGTAFFAGWNDDSVGTGSFRGCVVQANAGGAASVWGTGTLTCSGGYQLRARATAVASLLLTGGIQLDGVATGSTFVPATGLWGAPVASTPANVDANGSLQNPRTGTRVYVEL
jgi:hypothetical protein